MSDWFLLALAIVQYQCKIKLLNLKKKKNVFQSKAFFRLSSNPNTSCLRAFEPDAVPSLFPNGKANNKSVLSNIEKLIKLRKVKVSLLNIHMAKNAKRKLFHTAILRTHF